MQITWSKFIDICCESKAAQNVPPDWSEVELKILQLLNITKDEHFKKLMSNFKKIFKFVVFIISAK
jgi:hypothetical protein